MLSSAIQRNSRILCETKELSFSKSIPGSKLRQNILSNVNLQIEKNSIHGLIGSSGSGKTTLARLLFGLEKKFQGELVFHENCRRAMVFQDSNSIFNPILTIDKILKEPLIIQKQQLSLAEILQLTGLSEEILAMLPSQLSGGQRQRVNLARVLLVGPDLLLLDEPFSALDASVQTQIMELILDLKKKLNLTVLLIAHDLDVVFYLCDRISQIQQGTLSSYPAAELLKFELETKIRNKR